MSMKFFGTAGVILFGAVLASATQISAVSPSQVTVRLAPVRGSGASGTAILTQQGGKLSIVIKMANRAMSGMKMQENGSPKMTPTQAEGAHIHRGSCPRPDPKPLYPLQPVVNGTSTTTLTNTDLNKLTSGQYTISVHKTKTDAKNPIACGDIKLANPTGTSAQ